MVKRGRETSLPGAQDFDLKPLLDLVALGTIADLVPLTGENRILVTAGLERLNTTLRPGLIALKEVAQSPAKLGTHDVGFQLAPRLNAAGPFGNRRGLAAPAAGPNGGRRHAPGPKPRRPQPRTPAN